MAAKQSGMVIIGGGIMGGDIATIFAAGNWAVHVMSPSQKTRDALPGRVTAGLEKLGADKGLLKNLKMYDNLEAIPWADVDLVVEAATENIDLKRKLFSQLETLARPEIPLVSNTSNLRVAIAWPRAWPATWQPPQPPASPCPRRFRHCLGDHLSRPRRVRRLHQLPQHSSVEPQAGLQNE